MPISHTEILTKKKTFSQQQHNPRTSSHAPVAHHPAAIIQRARNAPESLTPTNLLQLQRTLGNRAVGQLISEISRVHPTDQQAPVQRQAPEEEEELMQGKVAPIQRQGDLEDEELLQGKFTDECIQCQVPEEEELMQGKFASGLTGTLQAKEEAPSNETGMPEIKASSQGSTIAQRLAMKYGNSAPIPEDSEKIATAQDDERGVEIGVQTIPGDISDDVFTAMGDREKVFIVAHGRAPIGNEPAVLQEGAGGDVLSGSDIAGIINGIKTGLAGKDKSMGEVKIEACMSSLRRKTKGGIFGETFIKAKPSLLTDIKASLRSTYNVNDIIFKGNPGFSTGNEFDPTGVQNLSPENTELGLLANILEILYDVEAKNWNTTKNAALKKDGLNIVRKFGTALARFDKNSQVSELIPDTSANLISSYLKARAKSDKLNKRMIDISIILSDYIRNNQI